MYNYLVVETIAYPVGPHRAASLLGVVICVVLSACVGPNRLDANGNREFYVPEEVKAALASAPSCCATMADFHYESLRLGASNNVSVDAKRPAFPFESGKSYFVAYALPVSPTTTNIRVKSWFSGWAFFPNLLLLDQRFSPVRVIGAPDVRYIAPGWTTGDGHVEATCDISPTDSARYLVIFTTAADMNKRAETKDAPDMLVTKSVAVFSPGGQHSNDYGPTGTLEITTSSQR